jgi:hypothetical protein
VFLDESEALTHPYLARCWARRGTELRIQAPGQAKKRAMLGAFDPVHRRLLVHTSPTKRSTDFIDLLDQLAPPTESPNAPGRWSRFSITGRSTLAS